MTAATDTVLPAAAPPAINKIGVTITTMLAMISMVMSSTMVNVAVPDIMGAFGVGQDQAHWMATGFLSAMTVSMLLNAWLVGRFGPRTSFLGAVGLFVFAAVLGQTAPTFGGLVLARVVQGMCAGVIQPLAMSTVFLAYPPEERGKAMGWFGMGIVLGPTIGPTLGGIIVDTVAWRWVFTAPVPVMAVSAALAWVFLPARDPAARKVDVNLISFALIALAIGLFLNGITEGQRNGWDADRCFLLLLGSAACFASFLYREASHPAPLIQLRLFSVWHYTASAIVAFVFGAGMFGTLFLVPVMVQTVQGFTATKAGLMLLPGGMVAMATFPIAGRLSQRVPPVWTISFGLIVFGVSCLQLASAEIATGFWTLALLVALGRVGLGLVIPSLNLGAMSAVPRELVPSAAGTLNFIRMTGAAIGVNTLAIIIDERIAIHAQALGATQVPGNVPMTELLDRLSGRLAVLGVPDGERHGAALAYVARLLELKAHELAFHDGFTVLTGAFGIGLVTTILLMRGRAGRS